MFGNEAAFHLGTLKKFLQSALHGVSEGLYTLMPFFLALTWQLETMGEVEAERWRGRSNWVVGLESNLRGCSHPIIRERFSPLPVRVYARSSHAIPTAP